MKLFVFILTFSIFCFEAFPQNNGQIVKQNKITKGVTFGRGLAPIGDLNKDGNPDLVIGTKKEFDQKIFVTFLDTSSNVKKQTIIKSNKNGFTTNLGGGDDFGQAITNLGDLNQDGVKDVAIGAPGANNRRGEVFILFMRRDGTVKDFKRLSESFNNFNSTINQDDYFGWSLGTLNDWNNNNANEILIGSPGVQGGGAFWVLFLNKNGGTVNKQKISNSNTQFNNYKLGDLGSAISGIGDLNNDGVPDLMVGDESYDNQESNDINNDGAVFTLFLEEGNQGKIKIKQHQLINSNNGNLKDTIPNFARFGSSIANMGDINGDTIQDIAVGSYGEPYKIDSASYNISAGKVRLLFMNRDGTVKDFQAIGNDLGNFQDSLEEDDQFGRSVANIGDLNGDRVPELAVGAPGHGGNNKGSVFILFLNGVPQTPEDTSSSLQPQKPFKRLNTYPNPVPQSQNLTLSLPSTLPEGQQGNITLFDMEGQLVRRKDFTYRGQPEKQLAIPDVAPGSYQLFLRAGDFQGFSRVVVGGR